MNVQQITASIQSGPVPSADELERYEVLSPGAAGRFIAMAETQQEHRHALEKRQQSDLHLRSILGTGAATMAMLTGFALAAYLGYLGQAWPGVGVAGLDVGAIVTAFLRGGSSAQGERQSRFRRLTGL